MLQRVISGFQTGADVAGVRAAYKCGIETGGYMTAGYRTELGPRHNYTKYGAVALESENYAVRTRRNVRESDATVRFASDWSSPGERCTKKAIDEFARPYLDIDINTLPGPATVARWLKDHKVAVLNIAGNKESTSPGIEVIVERYLLEVFRSLLAGEL